MPMDGCDGTGRLEQKRRRSSTGIGDADKGLGAEAEQRQRYGTMVRRGGPGWEGTEYHGLVMVVRCGLQNSDGLDRISGAAL
ncbi:hypothetical protein M0R45_024899 [Rubus argutus]|uniref:Uncharacterized protein n=1 Tax=Rubus argutus TaxID=59490 RepID=A0AAW1WUP3_RUBAR